MLISELRPAVLEELGLRAALEALAERTRARYGIDVTTAIRLTPSSGAIDPELETVVFRVAQEALTNAARHARADSIGVRLNRGNGGLQLSIQDDGDGFDTTEPTDGLGLLGMRERVSLVGGRFELLSSAAGTTVSVSLPSSSPALKDSAAPANADILRVRAMGISTVPPFCGGDCSTVSRSVVELPIPDTYGLITVVSRSLRLRKRDRLRTATPRSRRQAKLSGERDQLGARCAPRLAVHMGAM